MSKKTRKHPLDELSAMIYSQGLMVFDGVNRMPVYGQPYVSPLLVIALNHQGWLRASYDMQPVEFHPHDVSVIMPNHVLTAHESSPDYLCTLVAVTPAFLKEIEYHGSNNRIMDYMLSAGFPLDDEQYATVNELIQLLGKLCNLKGDEKTRICADMMDALGHLLDNYRHKNVSAVFPQFKGGQTFARFYDLLIEHHRQSREVQFYANLLCLSPKYFGSLIRQETGIGASEWIARYVTIQAKSMLRHRQDQSIQQISNLLGFPDQAAFTRYFKSKVGMSPKEYRENE